MGKKRDQALAEIAKFEEELRAYAKTFDRDFKMHRKIYEDILNSARDKDITVTEVINELRGAMYQVIRNPEVGRRISPRNVIPFPKKITH